MLQNDLNLPSATESLQHVGECSNNGITIPFHQQMAYCTHTIKANKTNVVSSVNSDK